MPLRLVVFDFDGTLCASHIWNALSGSGPSPTPLPPPFSRTERGQLTKIFDTDRSDLYGGPGGFAFAAFGGKERIELLHQMLNNLLGARVECLVCSRSLVGPLRKLLEQVGLLPYFTTVFGNTGCINPPTEYDMQLPSTYTSEMAPYLGTQDCSLHLSKSSTIRGAMGQRGLQPHEVLFIDDMPQEIEDVTGTCKTLHVAPLSGMGLKEVDYLLNLAMQGRGMPCPPPSPRGARSLPQDPGNGFLPGAPRELLPAPHESFATTCGYGLSPRANKMLGDDFPQVQCPPTFGDFPHHQGPAFGDFPHHQGPAFENTQTCRCGFMYSLSAPPGNYCHKCGAYLLLSGREAFLSTRQFDDASVVEEAYEEDPQGLDECCGRRAVFCCHR